MLIVSKCSQCNRGYTAPVGLCQICGGVCVPVSAEESSLKLRQAEAEPPQVPQPECPCCGGSPGPHVIAQQTRHQTASSLIPMKRTFLVTTVKVPGVCDSCHRSLWQKRLLASVLLPLPLPLFFGLLVVVDSMVAFVPVVLYLFYVGPRIMYAWTDFLLYGRELSWKLTAYVPEKDRESLASYPVGIGHVLLRLGLLPALVVGLFLLAQLFQKSRPGSGAKTAATAPATPDTVAPAVATPAPAAAPALSGREQSLITFLNGATAFAVPIAPAARANPEHSWPAAVKTTVDGKKVAVIKVYADEANVPTQTPYQVMNSVTMLIHCGGQAYDMLSVEDRQITFSRREGESLVPKIAMATNHPSEIRVKPAR